MLNRIEMKFCETEFRLVKQVETGRLGVFRENIPKDCVSMKHCTVFRAVKIIVDKFRPLY